MAAVLPLVAALQAHLWTAVMLMPAAMALGVGGQLLWRVRRDGWGPLLRAMVWALPSALLALPLVLTILTALEAGGGTAIAAIPGIPYFATAYNVAVPVVAVLAASINARRPGWIVYLTGLLGLALLVGVLLVASGRPTILGQWYPTKALWLAVLAGMPGAVIGLITAAKWYLALLTRATRRFGSSARVARVGITLVVGAALFLTNGVKVWTFIFEAPTVTTPYLPSTLPPQGEVASLSTLSAAQRSQLRVRVALDYGTRYRPAVTVPTAAGFDLLLDRSANRVIAGLIRLETGQQVNNGSIGDVCAELDQVAGDRQAVIVTALPPEIVVNQTVDQGCPGAHVEQLPWTMHFEPDLYSVFYPSQTSTVAES